MTVDDHNANNSSAEWHVTPVPSERDLHTVGEEQNQAFQHVFDQLELVQTDPENLSRQLNINKALWKLPTVTRQRIINHFVQAATKVEQPDDQETPEDRIQERLEDTAGVPSYLARAIARHEPMVIPTPRIHLHPRIPSTPEAQGEPDLFQPGTSASEEFVKTELERAHIQAEDEVTPETEVQSTKTPEPIKFGIEPNGMVTHTRRERRSATKLQEEGYNVGGGLKYLKVVSHYGDKSPEERLETMTKSLNHMFDYEENARATMDSLAVLLKEISQHAGGPEDILGDQKFVKTTDPAIIRALEAITHYREAIEAEAHPKLRVKGTMEERIERSVLIDTVDNVETTASELYFREEERQRLWDLQLRGLPSSGASNIPERFGAIDIVKDVPELAPIVEKRLRQKPADSLDQIAS